MSSYDQRLYRTSVEFNGIWALPGSGAGYIPTHPGGRGSASQKLDGRIGLPDFIISKLCVM
ncbi:MAG TPA: hypothetical protein VKA09_06785 [Nitrososphaeraceae archaeon]|nr:hypothetical protein [Nitrososphaeraceae archaeon]